MRACEYAFAVPIHDATFTRHSGYSDPPRIPGDLLYESCPPHSMILCRPSFDDKSQEVYRSSSLMGSFAGRQRRYIKYRTDIQRPTLNSDIKHIKPSTA